MSTLHAVTGAYSYSGSYIARRLLDAGDEVITLTGHPHRRDPFGGAVKAHPYNFDAPDKLAHSLDGVDTLFITYWVRFSHGSMTFAKAVANTKVLFDAAKKAGVRRVVYVSITHPSVDSTLPYFSGKGELERYLKASGLSYAILRPAVLFGAEAGEDVLINNIAWLLRRLPVFGVPGNGRYRLQPVHVEDLADLAVEHGRGKVNVTLDAVGPEVYSFAGMVEMIRNAVESRAVLVHVPPKAAWLAAQAMGPLLGDVLLTQDEVIGLMAGLLESFAPPTGVRPLSDWVYAHADGLGRYYSSEVGRHF